VSKRFVLLATTMLLSTMLVLTLCAPAYAAPSVTIKSPADGETVSGTAVKVSASVTSKKTISSVVYKIDSTSNPATTMTYNSSTKLYEANWDTTQVANGGHKVYVQATDSDGTTTKSISVTVSNTATDAPTVAITSPANGATVSGTPVTINADISSGSASYTITDVVYAIDNGTQVAMSGPVGETSGTWTANWDTTVIPDGSHTISVTATNSAGKTTTSTITVTVSNNSATTLTVQTVQNRYKYAQGATVVVRATAQRGLFRITSGKISSAKVTIKDPSGKTLVNAASMSKDSSTGFCFYSYKLASTAPKGIYSVSVTIVDSNNCTGTGTNSFKVQSAVYDHKSAFSNYEGTKTCITSACHATQASHVFSSVHYQWRGDNSKAIELAGSNPTVSKLGGINNFCIQPDNNWLTIFNKLDGTKGPGGCAWCHAGLGLKPVATSSQTQLENIDCLICHSPTYKRIVIQNADGTFAMAPDPTIDIQAAAKNLVRPTREMCMRCHQNAGGGNNYKRGDIESTNISCDKNYDVHMGSTASGGLNFLCQDCHRTDNHKMAGRGSDMRALDSTFDMSCESCHTQLPHRSTNTNYTSLNKHSDRVNCTVCHVKAFARGIQTDMYRDWSHMEIDTAKQLYDPHITFQSNVKPVYAWFNTFSHFYKFKDPVAFDANGRVKLSYPDGDFVDHAARPVAKLYPFKLHLGNQPMEDTTKQLLPLRNKIAFETGNVDEAIKQGAAAYGMTYGSHSFVQSEQYQSIHHTVGPKSTALASCSSTDPSLGCHGNQERIPFLQLGYQRRGTHSQLCDVCHDLKSYPGFTKFHDKHRKIKNCVSCHGTGHDLKEPKETLCKSCHSYKTYETIEKMHKKHVKDMKYDCSKCHVWTGILNATSGGHSKECDD